MKLRRRCKSGDSHLEGDCPAIERGLAFPTEMALRAAALVLAEHGRAAMLGEVDAFLAGQKGTGQ